jgi:hypothetical protein
MGIFNLIILGIGLWLAYTFGTMKGKKDATPKPDPEPPSPIDKPTIT